MVAWVGNALRAVDNEIPGALQAHNPGLNGDSADEGLACDLQ